MNIGGLRMSPLLLIGLLAGCSSISLRTNLPDQVNKELRSSTVEIYSQDEIFRYDYHGLGEVEVAVCRSDLNPQLSMPSDSSLTRELKLQTQQRGGNALVLYQCADKAYAGCYAYRECVGYAYKLKFD